MDIQDFTYAVKGGASANLVPITAIKSHDDIDEYREQMYNIIFTKDDFQSKYPNLDITKFYYTNSQFTPIAYFDKDKIIYKELPFSGKEYFKFNDNLTEEEEIIKIINVFEKTYNAKDWTTLLTSPEGAMRFSLLNTAIENNLIDQQDLYKVFISIYTKTDFGSHELTKESMNKILNSKTEEQKQNTKNILSAFGKTITIYRGEGDRSSDFTTSFSWTTDINVANFFAIRLAKDSARIIKARVKRADIIEYIDHRDEHEILVDPKNVEVINIDNLYHFTDVSSEYIDEGSFKDFLNYKTLLKHIIPFENDLEGHGKIHCLRVLLYSILIANYEGVTDLYDRDILFKASISHDMARDNDSEDLLHGEQSYQALVNALSMTEDKDLEFLMKYHSRPDRQGINALKSFPKDRQQNLKKLLFILKDADALDRVRFGIRALDMNFLRLDFSKKLTFVAIQALKGIEL